MEQIYNNMSKAMYEFNKALFNPLHKSYYNETDIQILQECRTIPPVGELTKFYKVFNQKTEKYDKYGFMPETTTEIDVRKAYTHAHSTKLPKSLSLISLIYGSISITKTTITASFTN